MRPARLRRALQMLLPFNSAANQAYPISFCVPSVWRRVSGTCVPQRGFWRLLFRCRHPNPPTLVAPQPATQLAEQSNTF
ncbi:hypothetical protein L226DRAFT_529235 [Lentinus tigrinus ALCF2SS1-7]|uniref:Uncharacterized protein n=1 Tax=Lentinus tigrinus ALCF2SS1-6 TaxID=1328759 RepID=A0A5C2ST40_9APHY|nr:hypothetical protein L227DRAFT_569045 [Lentinus tigrinus ALCF2SS1-6]RPD80776.1 hypothetical protein L226DRAFT_529235 [Lentinus tigrinus ALCF2SS1-7]